MVKVNQPSFAGGELAPALHARVDLAKYAVGLKTCRNFFVHAHGGVSTRSGTQFIGPVKTHGGTVRLISFSFNTEQTYVLEFGASYLRVIKDGGHVLEAGKTISGATQANPCVVTATAHGYSNGEEVYIAGVVGMTQLNGKRYTVANITTNTFELTDQVSGTGINSSAFTAYGSAGAAYRVYTLATPYAAGDLATLKFTQTADTLTLVHPSHAPRNLTRTGHDAWTLATITFAPSISAPASVAVAPQGASGSTTYDYRVTATAEETFEESLATSAQTTSGNATLSTTNFNRITWTSATVEHWNVYRKQNGIYGYIGSTEDNTFDDTGILPVLDDTPPKARDPFNGAGNYPSTVTYFQQRQIFAASNNSPQTLYGSQTGNFSNMNVSSPLKDDDAITFTLAASQVNSIRHMIPLNELIVLTSGTEWKMSGGASDAVTPSNVSMTPQSYRGAAHIPPIVSGNVVLFVQEKGNIVRDLSYQFEDDAYTGTDLTVLSSHLFEGNTLQEWAYSQAPYSIIWGVRSDGVLLGLTYMREHEVWAWHRHDTDGFYESVCCVSEGEEDAVYLVVRRTIGGVTRRYVERLHPRYFSDIKDAFWVDAGLALNDPVAITAATRANPVVVTAASHGFANGDAVDISDITEGMTEINNKRFKIANKTTNTFELTDYDTGTNVNGSAYTAYVSGGKVRQTVTSLSGLDHLEGEVVKVLADGSVLPDRTVTDGAITLPQPASRVHVGIGFEADIETLNIEMSTEGNPTIQGKKKKVSKVVMRLEKTRGLFVGPDENNLYEVKQRTDEAYGDPIAPTTGDAQIVLTPSWNSTGRVFVRQSDPLPATILSIVPEVSVGG